MENPPFIDLFPMKNLHLYRDFPWFSHDTGGYIVGSHILTYFPASTWSIIQGTHEDCTSEISRIENTWWNLRWTRNGGFSGSQGTPTVDVTRGHCPQHLGYGFPAWNLPGIYFSSMITGKKCDIPWLCSFNSLWATHRRFWTWLNHVFTDVQSLSSSCFSVAICTARQCHSCLRQSAAPWNATVLRFVAFGHCCDAGECWRSLENRIRKHCNSGDGGV